MSLSFIVLISSILIVAVCLVTTFCKLKKELPVGEFRGIIFSSILAPLFVALIFYGGITYSIDKQNTMNLSLDLDMTSATIKENGENFTVNIPIKQGGISEINLFEIDDSKEIHPTEVNVTNREKFIEFEFKNIKQEHAIDDQKNEKEPDKITIPKAAQFIIYWQDFNGNEKYSYIIIKPKIDLSNLEYKFSVSSTNDQVSKNYPVTGKTEELVKFFDIKFINEKNLTEQIDKLKKVSIPLINESDRKTVKLKDGSSAKPNPILQFNYELLDGKMVLDNLQEIIKIKRY